MRKFLIGILFVLLPSLAVAQIGGEDEVYLNADVINPTFNGGDLGNFYDYINKNSTLPK
jgi:hypothetical protein